jgi:hypothetical protein
VDSILVHDAEAAFVQRHVREELFRFVLQQPATPAGFGRVDRVAFAVAQDLDELFAHTVGADAHAAALLFLPAMILRTVTGLSFTARCEVAAAGAVLRVIPRHPA